MLNKVSQEISMTRGNIPRQMIAFAVPVFLGQLFQQLYNTVDSLIVGNLLGSNALAAVSSSGNLIFLLVGFFNGMAMGASVVISQEFGAKNYKRLSQTVHTTVALGLAISVVLTVLGTVMAPILLKWMGTPEEVMALSVDYFAIYFAGISGLIMYNLFSGIMRAVGDSKHPLYFLIASSILNVFLDLLFIAVLGWGVAGAAYATIFSQMISALLALITLCRQNGATKLVLSKVRFQLEPLKAVIRYGIPTGVQNSIISLANVVVQSNINAFGPEAMAGCGAYSKLEGFAFLPIMSFNMAISTFVGQNIGAKDYERTLKGAKFGILCGVISCELVGLIFFLFAPQFISIFDQNPAVIAYGADRARCNALFYFLLAYTHAVSAVMRGGGKPDVPMYVMMITWCAIRVGFLVVTAPLHNVWLVYWVYPLTWFLSSCFFAWYYPRKTWLYPKELQRSIQENKQELAKVDTLSEKKMLNTPCGSGKCRMNPCSSDE
ncbi:MATE family efflux transporter [Ileibacterium valens]|uniref:MATE family efflux transporter n=1 Tax=Ileibacterium valens TaxID=1862668 RepID=UPI0023540A06|nr:MATE family efflux transporter [Ileibacterium valens]